MENKKGYIARPLSFNRRAVIAAVAVTSRKSAIHSFTEVDVTEPRRRIRQHFEKTGEKLSLTAYIATCLAHVIRRHPHLNSFIKGRRLILLDDVTVNVLVEKEIDGEKVPESIGIKTAQEKTYRQVHEEVRAAQQRESSRLGSLSGQGWIRFIPTFLLKTFVRLADRNIAMAKRYGKVAVTAVGMFSKEAVWFIPHGSATVLITVGSIAPKVVEVDGRFESREHLCLTASFDHAIVDGAPAARFLSDFVEEVRSGALLVVR